MNQSIILENVIIENTKDTYCRANILIKDGIIDKLETSEIEVQEINSSSFYVNCGFVNSHLHPNQLFDRRMLDELSITKLLDGMHKNRNTTNEERYFQALFVIIDALKSGSTSIYAVASNPFPVIQAFNDLNLTGAISCFFNDIWEGVGSSPKQTKIKDVETLFSQFHVYATDHLKIHIGAASLLSASNDLLCLFNEIAQKFNTKVNIHISEGKESVETCIKKRGKSPIRLLLSLNVLNPRWNLIHATTIDEEEVEIVAATGASIIHCPVSNAKTGVGIAPIIELIKHKVNIGLGTDACSNNNTNNILNEAYFAILLHSAVHQNVNLLKEEDVLTWMTSNGLKIIDSTKKNNVMVGERADLLMWSLNECAFVPLPYGKLNSVLINNAPDLKPHTAIINGRKVIENYNLIPLSQQEINDNINMAVQKGKYPLKNLT